MKLPILPILAITLSFTIVTIADAKIYKWKDLQGLVHYASTPPRPSEKISKVKDDFLFSHRRDASNKEKRSRSSNKNISKSSSNESKEKRNACKKQKNNLDLLKNNLIVTWIEDGKEIQLSGKLRKDKIQILEEGYKKSCNINNKDEK